MAGTILGNRRKLWKYFSIEPKLSLNVSKLLALIISTLYPDSTSAWQILAAKSQGISALVKSSLKGQFIPLYHQISSSHAQPELLASVLWDQVLFSLNPKKSLLLLLQEPILLSGDNGQWHNLQYEAPIPMFVGHFVIIFFWLWTYSFIKTPTVYFLPYLHPASTWGSAT